MVWLESAHIAEAFSNPVTKAFFTGTRDGLDPMKFKRPKFGFRIKEPGRGPHGPEWKLGMQGTVLYCDRGMSYVESLDARTDPDDSRPIQAWIPSSKIEVSNQPYFLWKVDVSSVPRAAGKLTQNEREYLNGEAYRYLATAIGAFLKTLAQNKPQCLSDEDFTTLGNTQASRFPYITSMVIRGINRAGLVSTLNRRDFTINDIITNSKIDCTERRDRRICGWYMRAYVTKKPRGDILDFYIGQSADLERRGASYTGSNYHNALIKKSNFIAMRAICVVEKDFYDRHKFIVEQTFVSLFQSYRDSLKLRQESEDDNVYIENEEKDEEEEEEAEEGGMKHDHRLREVHHLKNFLELDAIAKAAAKISQWTGAVDRKSFAPNAVSCHGVNHQSPLVESSVLAISPYLRTDSWMPDPDNNGTAVPVANFLRATPKRATLVVDISKKDTKVLEIFTLLRAETSTEAKFHLHISKTLTKDEATTNFNDISYPKEGRFFDITFEVRLDWKPHPYSWARLPLVGCFDDWDRANSWALKIGWIDSLGTHRTRYIQSVLNFAPVADLEKANGAIHGYARGIEVSSTLCTIASKSKLVH